VLLSVLTVVHGLTPDKEMHCSACEVAVGVIFDEVLHPWSWSWLVSFLLPSSRSVCVTWHCLSLAQVHAALTSGKTVEVGGRIDKGNAKGRKKLLYARSETQVRSRVLLFSTRT
jgi:hypothetical protein